MEKDKQIFIKNFGKNLRKIRIQKNLTQAQIAADSNMEISQISRIERGVLNTSIGVLYSISNALEIDIKELFELE